FISSTGEQISFLSCGDCSMVFHSAALLEKHKALFCIGSGTKHPGMSRQSSEHLIRDNGGDVQPKQSRTPHLEKVSRSQIALLTNLERASLSLWSFPRFLPLFIHMRKPTFFACVCVCVCVCVFVLELACQLDVLAEQSSTSHLESLLTELREQEQRNEETLQQLAEHLHAQSPLWSRSLRQAYMQSGGSDPAIVAQIIDLQAEAQTLEQNQQGPTSWELLALERENQRLEEEILRLQAGFVIFYDLVLGVDANLKVLRLVAALYLSGEEVGHLTPLPPVQCQSRGTLPCTHSLHNGNYTPLSVKQFVPRMQPSPSLSLVVELQAAGGLDIYEQEVQKLESHGWAQLELFDQHNQVQCLHSGHWRAPVRSLPVQPSLTHSQLNSIPQVDNMELCVRLVNARDGDMQTDLKPDPSHYKYLAVVSMVLSVSSRLQASNGFWRRKQS
uniref:Coiled-coil domain containing 17 n=1 Tax=Myripristis murdjan TaxID=586833 RepID=A0A668AJX9_9TELE